MGDLLGSPGGKCICLWYSHLVSSYAMFFLWITCYMTWTFRREHCPPLRNNTTGTPGAHREACGHGRGAVKTFHSRSLHDALPISIIPALKHRILSELRS